MAGTSLVNWGASSQRLETFRVELQVLNLFDSKDPDISYYYASRLPGEVVEGIEDVHFAGRAEVGAFTGNRAVLEQ